MLTQVKNHLHRQHGTHQQKQEHKQRAKQTRVDHQSDEAVEKPALIHVIRDRRRIPVQRVVTKTGLPETAPEPQILWN